MEGGQEKKRRGEGWEMEGGWRGMEEEEGEGGR